MHTLFVDWHLSHRNYWEKRYKEETNAEPFDWLTDPVLTVQTVLPYLDEITNVDHINVLDLGCGNSIFPCELLQNVPKQTNIFCLDYISESLEFQRQTVFNTIGSNANENESRLLFVCGDAEKLPFHSNIMHLVFDKGTTDSLLKDRKHGKKRTITALSEVFRVIVPNGKLLQFTDEDPDVRLPLLEQAAKNYDASINYKILSSGSIEYFMYCVTV